MLRIPTLAFSLAESSPCRCPASRETIGPYIASLGKEQNSEFEVWFLLNAISLSHHCKVKKKSFKWNQHKSETVCTIINSTGGNGTRTEVKRLPRGHRVSTAGAGVDLRRPGLHRRGC